MGTVSKGKLEPSPFAARYEALRAEWHAFPVAPGSGGRSTADILRLYRIIQLVSDGLEEDYAREPQHIPKLGRQQSRWKPGNTKEVASILGTSETSIGRAAIAGKALLNRPELMKAHMSQEELLRQVGSHAGSSKAYGGSKSRTVPRRERKVSDSAAIWRSVFQEVNRQMGVLEGAGGIAEVTKGWTPVQRGDMLREVGNLLHALGLLREELEGTDWSIIVGSVRSQRSQWDT